MNHKQVGHDLNIPYENKLTFMVPGFSKCGTTMLCALLSEHPDIFIPEIKETNFFIESDYDRKWHEFNAHFAGLKNEKAIGEGTTFYSTRKYEKIARDRICSAFPAIRMIFIARNPVRRIESSYREFHHSGVNFGLDAPFGLYDAMRELPSLIDDTKYWERINTYREVLGDDRILVIFLEDLARDHVAVLRKCFAFLGVDPEYASQIALARHNSGEEKLFDSRLLRWMRTNRFFGYKIARLGPDLQNHIFHMIGLRKKFKRPIDWDDQARQLVADQVYGDARKFLAFYSKPAEYWPM